jgi:transketolase
VLNALASAVPELVGGSADLAGSNNTTMKDSPLFAATTPGGRNIPYGIREHAMAAAMNGMALHGGIIPFGGTFLIFSDYMRPAIRLAALMRQHVIYVFTHDSIGLGEDGPTHQPIEQLSALRAIPGLTVLRPGDASEVVEAWRVALTHRNGPVALILTRQKLPLIDRTLYSAASGVASGAYVLADAVGGAPQVVLIGTGSEVQLAISARDTLATAGIRARVVSMPSHELFAAQQQRYRDDVLPPGVPRVAIEAAHPMSWYRWVGDRGAIIGLDHFGASAPAERLFKEFGITAERVVEEARKIVSG